LTGCRLPKGLYTSLYQCIQPGIPRADVYLNCSILKKEFPLHFDEGSTPEKSALLNLHVDWGHLVLIIQTAPDFPIKKLAKELADAWPDFFWPYKKTVTITAAPGRDFLPDTVQLYQILSPYWSEKKLKV